MSDVPLEDQTPPAFYNTTAYYDPSIYPRSGVIRPPLATLPNYTNPGSSQFLPGVGGHGVSHGIPNDQHQDVMYLADSCMLASFQAIYDPSTGWFVPPNYQQQQLAQLPPPDMSNWSLYLQPTTHNVPQAQMPSREDLQNVGMGAVQGYGCGSSHGQYFQADVGPYVQNDQFTYQTNVEFYSAQAVSDAQNYPFVNASVPSSSSGGNAGQENAEGKNTQTGTKDAKYQCPRCQRWVLERRRDHHERKHDPNERYFCLICVVENEERTVKRPCEFSRVDPLKRHVASQHTSFEPWLPSRISKENPEDNDPLGLLKSRPEVLPEHLVPIRLEIERQDRERLEAIAQGND